MTNFTYNVGVPATNNNPSADQPQMLINTIATDGIIAVDHVGFNLTNGGQHKAITFNQNASYVPTPPVSPPQLFTSTVNTLPHLFYYTGAAPTSSDQYYQNSSESSTMLLGSMIMKFGKVISGSSSGSVLFTKQFPNNLYSIVLTAAFSTIARPISYTGTPSITGFSWGKDASVSDFYWLAIGN